MDRAAVIDDLLVKMGDDEPAAICRFIAARFRDALKAANPELSDAQMLAYDEAFAEQIPALSAEIRFAQIEAACGAINDEEAQMLASVASTPLVACFFDVLRRLRPVLDNSRREALQLGGVRVHAQSAERAFAAD